MKRLFLFFAAFGALLALAPPSNAQLREVPRCQDGFGVPTLPRIQGYVRDSSENGVADVRLELLVLNSDGSVSASVQAVKTDSKGHFRFKRHKDRIYALRVGADRKFDDLKLQQVRQAMMGIAGPSNLVLILEKSPCISFSLEQ